jgi:hypothetical protein
VAAPRLLVLALARDCALYLPRLFAFLDALNEGGEQPHAFVGENGSRDGTRALIEARACDRGDVSLVDTAAMAGVQGRYDRMALGRDIVAAAAVAGSDESVILLDLDSVIEHLPTPGQIGRAVALLQTRPELAGIAASSRPYYYDLLALRWPGRFERDVGPEIDRHRRHPLRYYQTFRSLIYPAQRRVTAATDRRCTSAFNGMCLYRAGDYFAQTYSATGPLAVCEHVPFNEAICARGDRRILISDDLPVAMPAEHGPVSAAGFFVGRTRKALRGIWSGRRTA